jgi:RecA-family ATPase
MENLIDTIPETDRIGNAEISSKNDNVIPEPSFDDSIFTPDSVLGHIEELEEKAAEDEARQGLFLVKPASNWIDAAKQRPIPMKLFGDLWYEGELCILYADTNLGKSILAVQIGNAISRGESISGFPNESSLQKILYFDFELSEKQFEARYSENYENHYPWDSNFLRAVINPDDPIVTSHQSFEEYLYASIEQSISTMNARVLIIDNITYLKNETEKAKDALPLMKKLKEIGRKHSLSILALAHTPKRDLSKPITRNDLQGSKMLINFCDSAFAIGESYQDGSIRYLKQIKARNTEIIYDIENVCICQIVKSINFLQFEFVSYGKEYEHLRQLSKTDKEKRIAEVLVLKEEGKSNAEIARLYGVTEGSIRKWLKKVNEHGQEK